MSQSRTVTVDQKAAVARVLEQLGPDTLVAPFEAAGAAMTDEVRAELQKVVRAIVESGVREGANEALRVSGIALQDMGIRVEVEPA